MTHQATIRLNDSLILDLQKTVLIKRGKIIHLTPKEANLLALLIRNAGQVVNRQDLMQEIWHSDNHADSRILDVHICLLRRKVEVNPQVPELILTRRGLGYELRA